MPAAYHDFIITAPGPTSQIDFFFFSSLLVLSDPIPREAALGDSQSCIRSTQPYCGSLVLSEGKRLLIGSAEMIRQLFLSVALN